MAAQAEDTSSSTQATARRLEKLHNIEGDIIKMLGLAAEAMEELSKDSPSPEVVEYKTKDFVKTIEGIEKGLSDEVQYLNQMSTTQAHEGSVYGIEKDYELSLLQTMLAKGHLQKYVASSITTSTPAVAAGLSSANSEVLYKN